MQAKELAVGQKCRYLDFILTRVMPQFMLPSMREWGNTSWGTNPAPSSEHIFLVSDDCRLFATHPENSVEAL